jgi:hypothetical protein
MLEVTVESAHGHGLTCLLFLFFLSYFYVTIDWYQKAEEMG